MNGGENVSSLARKFHIPKSTLHDQWKEFKDTQDISNFESNRNKRLFLLSEDEEVVVVHYTLWQSDRGMNIDHHIVKAIIRDIHSRAVEDGEKRKKINEVSGPSAKYMRGFYERHPEISKRLAERVDPGRINIASKDTIKQYFDLLKTILFENDIMHLDEDGNPVQESIKQHCIYLANETGWGVELRSRTVFARKGEKHIYKRKTNDESHKTLMLGVCGNGDFLKPLIILENHFL